MINIFQIFILAIIQGATELLPVSSSAHVVVAEKLMGLDPTLPAMTLLLVLLHTGTMLAVIVYFWRSWKETYFSNAESTMGSFIQIMVATAITCVVGLGLKVVIEKVFLKGTPHAQVEFLFGNLLIIAAALAAVGALILCTGFKKDENPQETEIGFGPTILIALVQGLCLPFRGFSRSGSTISTGILLGIEKRKLEEFSFALAVVLTPFAIGLEGMRALKALHAAGSHHGFLSVLLPGILGMVFSFFAGLLALKWLSSWLEGGRWYLFGFYCLGASVVIFLLYCHGL